MSPEMTNKGITDKFTDVWGIGAIIYELCTIRDPLNMEKKSMKEAGLYEKPIKDYSLNKLVMEMLAEDETQRPTAA